jgi:(2Fe-2S) ferredoxin
MSRLVSILIYSLTFSSFLLDSHALSLQNVKVQVCQNKDCCQRFRGTSQNLVQTIQHLCPEVQVESSACLSHCGKGPNICIQVNGEEHVHGEIVDAASAAAVLELETKVTIHPTLVAAVNVMERAYQAETPQEKERFLSSVISALDKKDELRNSYAMAHAHALRAKLFIKNKDYPAATRDAEFAVKLDSTNDLAWRSLADAHEASGNFEDAIKVLQRWSKARPAFSTKANKEIQRLRELM